MAPMATYGRLSTAKNGILEPAEREAYLKYVENQRKKLIQQFDSNGDGVLDEEERKAAAEFAFRKRLEEKAAARAVAQAGTQSVKPFSTPILPAR